MSFISAPIGPFSELFYRRDYWRPELFNGWPIGLEDLLFAFTIGGIATVMYEVFFNKKNIKGNFSSYPKWPVTVATLGIIWIIVGNVLLNFNSIYVSVLGFLLAGSVIILLRRDLLNNALVSGLLVAILMFVFYLIFNTVFDDIIQRWWLLKNLSGILLFGVPLEELMWGFGFGFAAGPTYKFIYGLEFKKSIKADSNLNL